MNFMTLVIWKWDSFCATLNLFLNLLLHLYRVSISSAMRWVSISSTSLLDSCPQRSTQRWKIIMVSQTCYLLHFFLYKFSNLLELFKRWCTAPVRSEIFLMIFSAKIRCTNFLLNDLKDELTTQLSIEEKCKEALRMEISMIKRDFQWFKNACFNQSIHHYHLVLDDEPALPTKANEEFRPFMRRLPEFKFW